MQLQGIREGDIVECDVKGRIFMATVLEKNGRELRLRPFAHNVTYFRVSARQVRAHWKRIEP